MSSLFRNIFAFIILLNLIASCNEEIKVDCEIERLKDVSVTAGTGEKPQSKVWFYDGSWRAVLTDDTGANIWLLRDAVWIMTLHLSASTTAKADVLPVNDIVHILLFDGEDTELVTVEYDSKMGRYHKWSKRPENVKVELEKDAETATIAIDGAGRMWIASDDDSEMNVRWSDASYEKWSAPFAVANDVYHDDICAVTSFPDGNIGVLWSNQNTQRFGFRIHVNGDNPEKWMRDENPVSGSALNIKKGMADDHINFAVASDGTLYVAVKTSYDTPGYPLIGLIIRHKSGEWDGLYNVDDEGSRANVLLSEKHERIFMVYSSYRNHKLVYRTSDIKSIKFGKRQTLIDGNREKNSINNVTGPKHIFNDEVVIIASENGVAKSVKINCRR